MAKPDCDDGWFKMSVELEAALDFADFTKLARTILRYVFMQIYGAGERPRYAEIDCSEIAGRIGAASTHVTRARRELIYSNVLVPVEGHPNRFRFVKDYEQWTFPGTCKSTLFRTDIRRLKPAEIDDCKDAPALARTFYRAKGEHETETGSRLLTETSTRLLQSCETSTRLDPKDVNPSRAETSTRLEIVPPYNPLVGSENKKKEKERESLVEAEADDAEPVPESPETTARRLRSLILKRTKSEARPRGNPDSAEFAASQLRAWLAEGYPLAIVRESIYDALGATGPLRMTAWSTNVARKLVDWKARTQAATPAPKLTKAQRDAQEAAERRAAIMRAFPPGKEAS